MKPAVEYPTYEAYRSERAKMGLQVIPRSLWNALKTDNDAAVS